MNVTIHPGQWFHHRHMPREHVAHRKVWQELSRNGLLWILAIMAVLFVVASILAIWLGRTVPANIPYAPFYPGTMGL